MWKKILETYDVSYIDKRDSAYLISVKNLLLNVVNTSIFIKYLAKN